jgi:hypothetical protein
MSFGPHDAELFRRLGRGTEISTLLDWILNEQIGLIVIKGESGAGKTSLLRAGLPAMLAKQSPPIAYHYWEAVPDQAGTGFLNAVKAGWGTTVDAAVPQRLSDLGGSGQHGCRRVIVLDQFEQLSPTKGAHQPIFRLLRNAAVMAMPPHGITYIVAFRADYASTWFDFQYDQLAGRVPAMMPLRLFNENQAKEIIAVIAEAADFTADKELVDDLAARMKNAEERISPADIGITLLALNERALAKASKHLDKGDYQIAGGATGLLAEYISSRLDRYRPDVRSNVVQAMLELADLGNDQRLAQGLLPDQLASKTGLPAATMQRYLNDLASPQVRLLEFLSLSGAYRLSHERLIPALRQLAGLVLVRAEKTGREFNRAYTDWVGGQRSHKLLLTGRRLSDVEKYRAQLYWGTDRDDKETFLKRSLTWRAWQRAIATAVTAALLAFSYFGWEQVNIRQYRRDLVALGLPTALIKSDQLTSLSVGNHNLANLRWLRCRFNELKLLIPKVENIEDLRSCRNLVSLEVNLRSADLSRSRSIVSDLDGLKDLKGLTDLTLNVGHSTVSNLDALNNLEGLTNLTLFLSDSSVNSLDALRVLKGLTHLTLFLNDSSVNSLDALRVLKGLTHLTLFLNDSRVSNLDALKDLKNLTNLTLGLDGRVNSLDLLKDLWDLKGLTNLTLDLGRGGFNSLYPLKNLKDLNSLTNLTLLFGASTVSSLDGIKDLKDLMGLTNLTLNLMGSRVSNLDALRDLRGLTNLALALGASRVSSIDALRDLKSLTNLKLDLGARRVSSIDALRDLSGLTNLTLYLSDSSVSSIDALKDLKDLTNLTLGLGSRVNSLDGLKDLKGLTDLTLNLGSGVNSLDGLKDLKGLTNLTLNLGSGVNSLDGLKDLKGLKGLKGLTNLTLNLGSGVNSLDALKNLKDLTDLTLNLGSGINSLDALSDLNGLTDLTLKLSNSTVTDLSSLQSFDKLETPRIFHRRVYQFDKLPKSLRRLVLVDVL